MICQNIETGEQFNYTFDDDGNVYIFNENSSKTISYECWLDLFFIVKKI